MIITTKINMDLQKPGVPAVINAVQGDKNTRCVEVSLYSGGVPWEIPEEVSVAMRYCKRDGTKGYYDTMPDGEPACSINGNVISMLLAPQMLTVAGTVIAQLEMLQGSNALCTSTMYVRVEEDPSAGMLQSEDYINWLQWMKEELEAWMSKELETGGYYTPVVSQPDNNTMEFSFVPSKEGMPEVEPVQVELPGGNFDYTAYGLPVVYLTGDITGMDKNNAVTLNYVYGEHSGTATVKWQGSSSLAYPKKNYTIKFDNAFEAVEGWGVQNKYCLKADWVDFSHCRNVVSAKLWGDMVRSRPTSELVERLSVLPNCGAIDGFPCFVVINDEWQGIYSFNIPKDGWMMGMGSGDKEAILCAEGTFTAELFLEEAVLGEHFELEYHSDSFAESDIQTSLNRLINAVINSDGTDLDTTIAQYVDIDSAIDYMIFTQLLYHRDGVSKNYLLATYDGIKWFFSAYDLDLVWGQIFGNNAFINSSNGVSERIHRLFGLLYQYKFERVKARYKELIAGVMAKPLVTQKFTNYARAIPRPAYMADAEKWKTIPNTGIDHIGQILNWYDERLVCLDRDYSKKEKSFGTKGLTYVVNSSGSNCSCNGIGTCLESDISIAEKYLDKDVIYILNDSFQNDAVIKNVTVPEGIVNIANRAFKSCTSLENITLPNSLTNLGYQAFNGCTSLRVIVLPPKLTTIPGDTFSGCTKLTKVFVPNTIPKLAATMFKNCTALKDIFFGGTIAEWEALTKETDWNINAGTYTIHCSDGDIAKDSG